MGLDFCFKSEVVHFGLVIRVVVSPATEFGNLFGQSNTLSVICVLYKSRRSENALSLSTLTDTHLGYHCSYSLPMVQFC